MHLSLKLFRFLILIKFNSITILAISGHNELKGITDAVPSLSQSSNIK